jgi:chondroitin AC lyase
MTNKRISIFIISFLLLASVTTLAQDPTLRIIKQRVVSDLMAPGINQTAIGNLVKTIRTDGTWPGIDYKDVSRTGFQHKDHLENMLTLARAYKKTGTPYYQNEDVKKTFSAALDFWLANDFRCDNWWWNEMGTPNLMINTLLVMDSSLTENQRHEGWLIAHRANMETFGARPGGDLMPIAGMFAKQGLFLMNDDTLSKALKAMQADIKISTGRGLKPDMSFHHRTDNVISTLTYGSNYASSFAYWAAKTAGTKFSYSDQLLQLVVNYFLDGICQSLVYRTSPDPGAMNRDISRRNALEQEDNSLPQNLLTATTWRAKELQEVLDVRNGKTKPNFTRDRYFWYSHYYTHQRPNYFASVRMHSARANNMEEPHNEEGIRNHFYGDGSLFISRTAHEFNNIFPVWDWRKIPGATIMQKPEIPHWRQLAKKGLTDFSGGVSDGTYGVAAFDFASVHDPLKAHKSWFFFDKEIVCLGTAITADTAMSVASTLNQCLLNGQVVVSSQNKNTTLQTGKHSLQNISWVLHDSVAYIFPKATNVQLNNTEAVGSWRQINHQAWATDEPVKRNVFTLWLDHGVQPQNAGYAWIVVPNMSAASTAIYNKQLPVKIIANTADLQAVQHTALERTGIVFYKAGSIKINDKLTLATNQPCIIMIKAKGAIVLAIAVTDPTQKLSNLQLKVNERTIEVELPKGAEAGSIVKVTP